MAGPNERFPSTGMGMQRRLSYRKRVQVQWPLPPPLLIRGHPVCRSHSQALESRPRGPAKVHRIACRSSCSTTANAAVAAVTLLVLRHCRRRRPNMSAAVCTWDRPLERTNQLWSATDRRGVPIQEEAVRSPRTSKVRLGIMARSSGQPLFDRSFARRRVPLCYLQLHHSGVTRLPGSPGAAQLLPSPGISQRR
jgi:hypothetical protein